MKQKLLDIMEENGIQYKDNRLVDSEAISSITFVSAIVDIEETFHIYVPDELVDMRLIENIEELSDLIESMIQTSSENN
jgi:acyl carrier protein